MDNRSSNKTADCWTLQTVASRQTCHHEFQAPAVDPPLHFTQGRWAFSFHLLRLWGVSSALSASQNQPQPSVAFLHRIYLPLPRPSSFQRSCRRICTNMRMIWTRSRCLWIVRLQSASEADASPTQRQEHKIAVGQTVWVKRWKADFFCSKSSAVWIGANQFWLVIRKKESIYNLQIKICIICLFFWRKDKPNLQWVLQPLTLTLDEPSKV